MFIPQFFNYGKVTKLDLPICMAFELEQEDKPELCYLTTEAYAFHRKSVLAFQDQTAKKLLSLRITSALSNKYVKKASLNRRFVSSYALKTVFFCQTVHDFITQP